MPEPTVSIVTICRNDAAGLAATLGSVAEQDYPKLEQVVVDGGSTDDTLAVLQRQGKRVARFVSEPDRGIADAFNKGIRLSSGRWILMLNAGDRFRDAGALGRLAAHAGGAASIVSARARCAGRLLPRYRVREGLGLMLRAHLAHQATLVERGVYERHGGYDEAFRIRMDFDFFLRVLPRERLVFIDDCVVEFEPGGVSGREFGRHWSEGRRALRRNRAGALQRALYEAAFCLMACERLLSPRATPPSPPPPAR